MEFEQKLYEAFGVNPTGENVQEPAVPAQQASSPEPGADGVAGSEGENAQEPAAPAEGLNNDVTPAQTEPNAGAAEPGEPANTAVTGEGTSKGEQTPEQRKAFAAQRRKQEQQAAVDAAVQAEREKNEAEMAEFFKAAGLKNTFTGEVITSLQQFNEWNEKFRAQKLQDDLRAGKLTQEGLEQVIANHPLMKQAGEVIRQSQEQQRQVARVAAEAKVNEQVAEIGRLDPSIQNVEDLLDKPWYPEFYEYVKRGFTLPEAYRQVNHEAMMTAAVEAARQQAINNTRGKDHLTSVGSAQGAGAVSVPSAEMALFRSFMPNATEAEIQAYYNQYKK